MLSNLSSRITRSLIRHQTIDEADGALYQYGLFMLLSKILLWIIACIAGLLFGVFSQSVLFFFAFLFLRQYAGGYHASTETRCQVSSGFAIFFSAAVIRLSHLLQLTALFVPLFFLAAAAILFFAPLDTPEKPLNRQERKKYRILTYFILGLLTVLFVLGNLFGIAFLPAPIAAAVIFEGTLIALGEEAKLHRKERETTE